MSNIGIITYWSRPTGIGYVSLRLAKTLIEEHNIFIGSRGSFPITEEFNIDIKKLDILSPEYNISSTQFKNWLIDNKIEHCIFIEEQWKEMQPEDLVDICNELKIKSYNLIMWERFNPKDYDYYEKFTKILCPTKICKEKVKLTGLENYYYLPWGAEPNFKVKRRYSMDYAVEVKTTQFFHPAGLGGMGKRKNSEAVIKSFKQLIESGFDAELLVTLQNAPPVQDKIEKSNITLLGGNRTKEEIANLYKNSDVIVLPSKWEGLGLPFIEALSYGKPVITVNYPPMNEIILNNTTGCCAKTEKEEEFNLVFVKPQLVDIEDLRKKMIICCNPVILQRMSNNAKVDFMKRFDWNKNKEKLLELFK